MDTKISGPWAIGSSLYFENRELIPSENSSLPAVLGNNGGKISMLSMTLKNDNRDNANDPWYGGFRSISWGLSSSLLGSDYNFENISFDVRQYFSVGYRQVLAARFLYSQAFGEAPFYFLPTINGVNLGRGYPLSRFIDKMSVSTQFEYRFPVYGIISGKLFAEGFEFSPEISGISWNGLHYDYGTGLRIDIAPDYGVILCFDLGFTPEGSRFIFNFGNNF